MGADFFSLTRDEKLGFLEYHKALQRRQPYILEISGGCILIRCNDLKARAYGTTSS